MYGCIENKSSAVPLGFNLLKVDIKYTRTY